MSHATTAHQPSPTALSLPEVNELTNRICGAVTRVLTGKPEVVRLAVAVLLSEGHLLVEDVPGVGKTTLAKAMAGAIDGSVGRIQFTPDLLPSDLIGVNIYRPQNTAFEFHPGPLFAHIVIGDEINRASPKTQSALLECMQERTATVDGKTRRLPDPFIVIATQNPVEMEGTYPLPEAQRDRFTAQISMGYPDFNTEVALLDRPDDQSEFDNLRPVVNTNHVRGMIQAIQNVHAAEPLKRYIVELVTATRNHPAIRLGASPRASLQLVRVARAWALMAGRDYVLPEDVRALAQPVLTHRLIPNYADAENAPMAELVNGLLQSTPLPTAARKPQ